MFPFPSSLEKRHRLNVALQSVPYYVTDTDYITDVDYVTDISYIVCSCPWPLENPHLSQF
jgi:hypothetical protein